MRCILGSEGDSYGSVAHLGDCEFDVLARETKRRALRDGMGGKHQQTWNQLREQSSAVQS